MEPTPGAVDELHVDPASVVPTPRSATASLLLTHAGSAAYGTFVHAVLEHVDFTTGAPHDGRALLEVAHEEARRVAVPAAAAEELVAAIPALVAAPIARREVALPEGFSLSRIAPTDRLDELAFDLRLGAGTGYTRGVRTGGLASLEALFAAMHDHPEALPSAWVRDFEARTRGGRAAAGLVGILRGAIDLVFRTREAEPERSARATTGAADRYWIADYKTNRLRGSSLDPYVGEGLREAMIAGDYLLQALLYTVALHRELRVRVPGYAYERHVGGFLYLFVRGMGVAPSHAGEASPGVYASRFPESLVTRADAALAHEVLP
jgi:exodeoxyribonuclease V beta subunit